MKCWMVRAGRGGRFLDGFREESMVAIGWSEVGDLGTPKSRIDVAERVRDAFPAWRDQAIVMASSQLFRFAVEFAEGDRVVTYDPRARAYLCGQIAGPYVYRPEQENREFVRQRRVTWLHEKAKDELSTAAQNSLGAVSTIFAIPAFVSAELWSERTEPSLPSDDINSVQPESTAPEDFSDEEVQALASEAIKDRIAELDWEDMQELVAGLLRAMGYKTAVSAPGADRGKDIVASPDGFGFQDPRIVVEVKHRRAQRMGSQEIRSFLGGRHPSDKGLYVSTGGFSKDAYYEAERSNIPLTLLDFEGLVDAILEHYSNFDEETKQILPLRRVYWPISK